MPIENNEGEVTTEVSDQNTDNTQEEQSQQAESQQAAQPNPVEEAFKARLAAQEKKIEELATQNQDLAVRLAVAAQSRAQTQQAATEEDELKDVDPALVKAMGAILTKHIAPLKQVISVLQEEQIRTKAETHKTKAAALGVPQEYLDQAEAIVKAQRAQGVHQFSLEDAVMLMAGKAALEGKLKTASAPAPAARKPVNIPNTPAPPVKRNGRVDASGDVQDMDKLLAEFEAANNGGDFPL